MPTTNTVATENSRYAGHNNWYFIVTAAGILQVYAQLECGKTTFSIMI